MAEPVCFLVVCMWSDFMFILARTSTNNLGSYVQSDEKY